MSLLLVGTQWEIQYDLPYSDPIIFKFIDDSSVRTNSGTKFNWRYLSAHKIEIYIQDYVSLVGNIVNETLIGGVAYSDYSGLDWEWTCKRFVPNPEPIVGHINKSELINGKWTIFNSIELANNEITFEENGILSSTFGQSWERFKFGGQPGSQQLAFYVNLKEIPNNRFGTQSEIYWNDAYLNAQVGAVTRGTYTLKIVDPVLFVKNFVPVSYLQPNAPVFDFADMDNDAATQLFNEVVSSLSAAFSNYTNDPNKGNRITKIQGDQIGFAQSLSQAVEDGYHWKTDRGLEIIKVAIQAIEYDEDTKALLSDVKKADALSGNRGNAFMQQAMARGFQAAGENPNGGAAGMAFMGMGMNAVGGAMNGVQQPATAPPNPFMGAGVQQPAQPQQQPSTNGGQPTQQEDPYQKLTEMKKLLDAGVITQADFDAAKKNLLGI